MKKSVLNFKSGFVLLAIVFFVLLITGCAQNGMLEDGTPGTVYGFWGGLWHGIIAPFGLVGMLIWDDVAMFAPSNNGIWYSFGFLLGSGGWGLLASRKRR